MSEWLTPKEAAAHLRTSVHMIRKLTRAGRLPPPVKLATRTTRYRREDLDAHLTGRAGELSIDEMLKLPRRG